MILVVLLIIGMIGGYLLAFIDPNGVPSALLGGILAILLYIAVRVGKENSE